VVYRGPRGTYDVYPSGAEPHERPELWAFVEETARDLFRRYNYAEIRTPIFEEARLFARTAGEGSDIVVQKEMFTFRDKGERGLALRPEGTPGAVRAYVEHNLYKLAQPVKLFYVGPMFRQERQQKGRYRQHTQIGVEVLGTPDPLVDVEVISLLYATHQAVGVRDEVVYLNNLGDMQTRRAYVPELRAYLHRHQTDLDPDSVSRLETNPLRTFDSKDEGTQAVLAEAPKITGYLSEDASEHLSVVRRGLEDVFFVTLAPEARLLAARLAGVLRAEGLSCDLDYGGRGTKGQFKQADRSGAAYAVVIGEDELARGTCNVRDMSTGEERAVPVADGPKELLRAVAG
jgi:histidyl-tRNA synthetase